MPNSIVVLHSNDIMPMCADGVMPFVQNSNMIHLTGADQEETILLLFPDAPNKKQREILFVRETNERIAIWEGEKYTKEKATEISGIESIQWTDTFDNTFHNLVQQAEHIYLSTNERLRADVSVETRNDRFIKKCKAAYPLHKYERLSPLMHKIRTIKQPEEIKVMQKACDITELGFRRVLKQIKPGVGEWEIEATLTHEFLIHGSKGHAYTPIVGGGHNACVLHYVDNNQRLKDGDMVLMDVGAEYANWNADMTRTVPVNGKFTNRQRAVYNAVLKVLRQANEILRPGLKPSEYQKQVLGFMEVQLIKLGLIDTEEAKAQDNNKPLVKKYFMHGTSHHLGLDVHDVSPPDEPFAIGQVFTIEPGIYIREENLGCRIENDVQIREGENFDLMCNIPIEADEIEALMAE